MYVTQNRSRCSADPERRQSNMCYRPLYARLLCMVLVVISIITGVIPAEAASENLMIDLFTAADYSCFKNDEYIGGYTKPASYFNGASSVAWRWQVFTDYIFSYCYFTVYCNTKPDKMQVSFYSTQSYIDAEYVGNDGYTYQYRVKCGSNNSYITVKGIWNNDFTGTFNVNSFIGVKDIGNRIDMVDVYNSVVSVANGVASTETVHNGVGIAIPRSYTVRRNVSINWLSTLCYISVPSMYRSYDNVDKISFILHGIYLNEFEVSLCDSSGVPVHVITPEVNSCEMRSSVFMGEHDYPYSYYEVTADLSSYNLKDLTIRLGFEVTSYASQSGYRDAWYSIDSIIELPYIEVTPWYKTFWNWLSSKWDSVTSSVKSSISSAADKISAAFVGGSAQNEALENAGQAMSDQAGVMNDAQAGLDSVEKPPVDPDELFGDMLVFDIGGLQILAALTNNPMVTAMLTVVFTFALAGYIFFGKKG